MNKRVKIVATLGPAVEIRGGKKFPWPAPERPFLYGPEEYYSTSFHYLS